MKSRYFQEYFQSYKNFYEKKWEWLVDLNIAFILLLMELLSIKTPTLRSSSMKIDFKGNLKVIELCKALGADKLYDAAGAVEFIDNDKFQAENIEVDFQNYEHPTYSQLYGEFISHMSVVDLLFNEGPKSLDIIRSGASRFLRGGTE